MTRTPARIVLRVFLALATVHLVWHLTGQEAYASASQWFLMPVLAAYLLIRTRGAARGRLVTLTLVALGFSWLGDGAPDLAEGDISFLLMVGFFLVAQVVYIVAFWPHRHQSVLHQRRGLLLPYAVAIAALILACAPHAGALLVPVLVYGLLLGTMAVLATGLNGLVWAGGALFLVSDGLIALNAFAPWWDLPGQGFWVMLTYIAAQLLIVLGVLREAPAPVGRGPQVASVNAVDPAP
ncbi:lysoplasmalogenase [Ornithinimicrobium ciconiae]|uniref:Lysoplasmalogenase n=1 Tax=Ornithinimicrobium ciconiae TaxID=2594265 RepID=A0A516G8L3_9MICO|nr:lysoplasmalogenase [Ornithinimicrobium ciconiae]QDO87864.1 lysoplasmalogenase [Ornithinimicrobium ciconiae]